MATQTSNDVKAMFSVTTAIYDAYDNHKFEYETARPMHYKAVASYATKVIKDPANYYYTGNGRPVWHNIENLAIHDTVGGIELIKFDKHGGNVNTWIDYVQGHNHYGPLMYIIRAMENAVSEIKLDAEHEMTPSEIAKEFGLGSSTVRKAIHENEEILTEIGAIRKADGRTWMVKRGYALYKWGGRSRKDTL